MRTGGFTTGTLGVLFLLRVGAANMTALYSLRETSACPCGANVISTMAAAPSIGGKCQADHYAVRDSLRF